ncbi:MAG: hypothetical protein QXP38_13560 [Nitrososphaerota archaeon]
MMSETEWVIDVWNCRGRLCVYGGELEQDSEYINIGYFYIPIQKKYKEQFLRDKKLQSQIQEWCWRVINDHNGGINISGIYHVSRPRYMELYKILNKALKRWENE